MKFTKAALAGHYGPSVQRITRIQICVLIGALAMIAAVVTWEIVRDPIAPEVGAPCGCAEVYAKTGAVAYDAPDCWCDGSTCSPCVVVRP